MESTTADSTANSRTVGIGWHGRHLKSKIQCSQSLFAVAEGDRLRRQIFQHILTYEQHQT